MLAGPAERTDERDEQPGFRKGRRSPGSMLFGCEVTIHRTALCTACARALVTSSGAMSALETSDNGLARPPLADLCAAERALSNVVCGNARTIRNRRRRVKGCGYHLPDA